MTRAFPRSAHSCLFGVLTCWLALLANVPNGLSDDAANVEPFVSESTWAVIKVDTSQLALPESLDQFAESFPQARKAANDASQWIENLRKAANNQPIYATIGIPNSSRDIPACLFLKNTPQVNIKVLHHSLRSVGRFEAFVRNGMLVSVPQKGRDPEKRLDQIVPEPREALATALGAISDYPIQLLILPPDFVRRTMVEMQPTLPTALGGGSSRVLTDGLLWGAVGVDPAKPRVTVVIQSASQRAAQDFRDYLPNLAEAAYQALPEIQQRMPRDTYNALSAMIASNVEGDRLVIQFADREAAGGMQFVAGVLDALQQRTARDRNRNKLKQLMLAIHNHHDAYAMLPPRDKVRDKEGRSGLSWRVHLLPFVEERKLYEQFHLDEPWDSPHNKQLIDKMPKAFQCGQPGLAPGHTTFVAPVGEDTVFGGTKPIRFQNVIDGSSNTLAVVQVKPELAVPWTAPKDYAFDPQDPGKGLWINSADRFLAAMLDGSVHQIRGDLDPETLLHLFQKGDRNPVEFR